MNKIGSDYQRLTKLRQETREDGAKPDPEVFKETSKKMKSMQKDCKKHKLVQPVVNSLWTIPMCSPD